MDQFAGAGYLTVIPNYQDKVNNAPPTATKEVDLKGVISKGLGTAGKRKAITEALEYLKSKGCTKIGAVGYCAGAAQVIMLISATADLIVAGFIAHPAGVTESSLKKIKSPLSITAASEDMIFTRERREKSEGILSEDAKVPFQINLYSHVRHGFAVRRAVTTRAEVWAKRQAFIQAVRWFEEHLFEV